MKTVFCKHGNVVTLTDEQNVSFYNELPVGTYIVKFDSMNQTFFLETFENFVTPTKIYGATKDMAKRIISTFNSRNGSTGVLLSGEKGSGKTLLSQIVSSMMGEMGYSTILVDCNYRDEKFKTFIKNISTPCVIIFDEFEKVYDINDNEQDDLLTLLEGIYTSKKLYIFTCNNTWRISNFMLNRPGRIYYHYKFSGVDENFIKEYCNDKLDNKSKIESIIGVSKLFPLFSFDILKAIVEEINRYDEEVFDVLNHLNADPISVLGNEERAYTVIFEKNGVRSIAGINGRDEGYYGSPLDLRTFKVKPVSEGTISSFNRDEEFSIPVVEVRVGETVQEQEDSFFMFKREDLVNLNGDNFIFKNSKGEIVTFVVMKDNTDFVKNNLRRLAF